MLWHYTSAAGLAGILSPPPALRATHLAFLNDSREFVEGVDLVRIRVDTRRQSEKRSLQRRAWDRLYASIQRGFSRPHSYVFCLSEKRDDLSQWRAYSRLGGYSIGFPTRCLRNYCANALSTWNALSEPSRCRRIPPFVLQRVEYDDSTKGRHIDALIQSFADALEGGTNTGEFGAEQAEFEELALGACARLKNAAFAAEMEWRLVGYASLGSVCFRGTSTLVVPFVNIELPQFDERSFWDGVRVLVGPSPHQDVAVKGARMLLHACFEDPRFNVQRIEVAERVTTSEIPFREI